MGISSWRSQTYPASVFDAFGTACVLEANKNYPIPYGANPSILGWQGWDPSQQAWTGVGCIVLPGADRAAAPGDRAALFARYPAPWPRDRLLVLRTDPAHMGGIVSTLQFTGYVTPTPQNGVYNSPACALDPKAPAKVVRRTDGLVITEYAIADAGCHPWVDFDGFQARERGFDGQKQAMLQAAFGRDLEQANRALSSLRLSPGRACSG